MQVSEFFELSKMVDSTLQRVAVANLEFRNEADDIQMWEGGKLLGTLSDRGLRNLSRMSIASPRLLLNQQTPVLNSVIKTQFAGVTDICYLKNPANSEEVISIFPAENAYVPYTDLLDSVKDKIFSLRGNPVHDDAVTILVNSRRINLGDDTVIGPSITISATSMSRSRFSYGGFRIICENGWIDNVFRSNTLDNIDANVVRAMFRDAVDNEDSYATYLNDLFSFMRNTNLNQDRHWFILSQCGLPKSVVDKYKAVVAEPHTFGAELEGAKVASLASVLDSFHLLTHLVKEIDSPSSRNRAESGIFKWAAHLIRLQ